MDVGIRCTNNVINDYVFQLRGEGGGGGGFNPNVLLWKVSLIVANSLLALVFHLSSAVI